MSGYCRNCYNQICICDEIVNGVKKHEKARNRCIAFLEQNGWQCDVDTSTEEYTCYIKDRHIEVDIGADEMVFISNSIGDFLHIPINYYTLVGVLMEYRQIDYNYARIKVFTQ